MDKAYTPEPNTSCVQCGERIENDESFVRLANSTYLHINNTDPSCCTKFYEWLYEWSIDPTMIETKTA